MSLRRVRRRCPFFHHPASLLEDIRSGRDADGFLPSVPFHNDDVLGVGEEHLARDFVHRFSRSHGHAGIDARTQAP